MVINMDESRLRAIKQIEQFLSAAHLLKRAYTLYGDARYERLAGLS